MSVRHAVPSDLDALARIEALSYPPEEGASRESIEKRLAAFGSRFWLFEEEGRIRGFINGMLTDETSLRDEMYDNAGLHNPEGKWQMIFSVVTDPEFRGCGVASRLMEKVVADCREEQRAGIVLTCKERLIPFYSRFGFKDEGVSTSEHGGVVWHEMRLTFPKAG